MNKLNLYLIVIVLGFTTMACENNLTTDISSTIQRESHNSFDRDIFAHTLAKSIYESQSLRLFIKEKALNKFDNDYDILLPLVKNEIIDNGKSFKEILSENMPDSVDYDDIEDRNPLLTIFVPTLPENTFSPQNWDISTQIPFVAVNSTDKIKIYNHKGLFAIINRDQIPYYPVIVLKDCERIRFNNNKSITRSSTISDYIFIDECYRNTQSISVKAGTPALTDIDPTDPKIIAAYNIYEFINGWHRDYIYYNITPTDTSGLITLSYQEYIKYFKLGTPNDTGERVYDRISDSSLDPEYVEPRKSLGVAAWTDGAFEFLFTVKLNAKNGIGENLKKHVTLAPEQIFDLQYTTDHNNYYIVSSFSAKNVELNLPLFTWDLMDYSPSIKISIEEVDPSEVITTIQESSATFATNFNISLGGKKMGLKFGASSTETSTVRFETTIHLNNDQFGDIIVNFSDNILVPYRDKITGQLTERKIYRKYYNSYCTMIVAPEKRY